MKTFAILWTILCVGLIVSPSAAQVPPKGLDVRVTNTPLPVTGAITATVGGKVEIVNTPNVKITNDKSSPVPVTIQNGETTTTTIIQQNLYTAGPGGRTIAGPGQYDFTYPGEEFIVFHVSQTFETFFYACCTVENGGQTILGVTLAGGDQLNPGQTRTYCEPWKTGYQVKVTNMQEGPARVRWRVDQFDLIK